MTESKTIWLARHGKTIWNSEHRYQGRQNSSLTTEGRLQAKALGEFLLNKNIKSIYSSSLGRAMETTMIIQSLLDTNLIIMPELVEMSFGLFEGHTQAEMKEKYAQFFSQRQDPNSKIDLAYPDGESYRDIWERLAQPILSLLAFDGEILIVAHNSVNRVIRAALLGKELIDVVNFNQENNQVIEISPINRREEIHGLDV